MRKYDKESNTRIWEGIPRWSWTAFMVVFSVYCLLMTLLSTEQAEARLARFIAFVIVIGFIMYPARKTNHKVNHIPWYDIVLMLLGFGSFMYFAFNATDILMMGARIEPLHVALAIIGILVLVELCRRCVGLPHHHRGGLLIIYAFYWQMSNSNNPDLYAVAAQGRPEAVLHHHPASSAPPINVCYTYIVLFVIFGAFLERTGIANFFIALANKVAGWSSGGAAKVAVIASALCGMVSGSSVGNVVTTGLGHHPHDEEGRLQARVRRRRRGGSLVGRPDHAPHHGRRGPSSWPSTSASPTWKSPRRPSCRRCCTSRGIFIAVHLEAKKLGLRGIPRKELPKGSYLLKNCYLIIPLVLLVWIVTTGTRTMAVSAAISHPPRRSWWGFINFLTTNWS